jgi:hypothetical protein
VGEEVVEAQQVSIVGDGWDGDRYAIKDTEILWKKIASAHRSTSQTSKDMKFTKNNAELLLPSGRNGVQDGAERHLLLHLSLPHDGTCTWTDQGDKKGIGRDVNDWLLEGDILVTEDASQDTPAHYIRFNHNCLKQLNQLIPDGNVVLAMGPYCAAGHESVHSMF